MTAKRYFVIGYSVWDSYNDNRRIDTRSRPICDLLNQLNEENEQLKQDNNALIKMLENQSVIIQELHSKILEYELKEPIVLTKEDLEIMGKAISYYLR